MGKKCALVLLVALVLAVMATGTSSADPPRPRPQYVLGDVNNDGAADSTDAMIILVADGGLADAQPFCATLRLGDVNMDWLVDSTDALIVLAYDAGMPVGWKPVGKVVYWFPWWVQPPLACR